MRIYYRLDGKRSGYSLSGGEMLGGCLVRAAFIIFTLIWPLAAATGVTGKVAPWGFAAEAAWVVFLGLLAGYLSRRVKR
jgi:hypothetical protein